MDMDQTSENVQPGLPGARTVIAQAGYRRERLPDGTLVLRLLDARPETVEAWYQDCNRLMGSWRPGRRLRYVHDIRQAEYVTPFATERVARVLWRMRQIPVGDACGAILVHNPTLAALLDSFVRNLSAAGWRIRVFESEAEALTWLSMGENRGRD
jgi:hypothetical protein